MYLNSSKHIPCFLSPDNSATIEFAESKQKQITVDIMSHSTKWPKQFPSEWDTKTIYNLSRNFISNCTVISSSECQQRSTTFPKVNIAQKQTTALKSEILYPLDEWVSHNSTRFRLYGLDEDANRLFFKHEPNYGIGTQLLNHKQMFPGRLLRNIRREMDPSRPTDNNGQVGQSDHMRSEFNNGKYSITIHFSHNFPSIDSQIVSSTSGIKRRLDEISHRN